jgi:peptide/nickel transport system substrate-binding protein
MGKLSRREFLGYSAAVAAGGALLGSTGSAFAAGLPGRRPQEVEEPHAGGTGTVAIGMRATLTSLTPFAIQGYQWSQMMGYVLYDPLVEVLADGSLAPVAAASWDTTSPTETVINVRPGMLFHDGSEVTAEDVAYSIAARCDPKVMAVTNGRPVMSPKQWVGVTTAGKYKVIVSTTTRVRILEQPQPILVVPNNAHSRFNVNTQDVGSGPFTLENFVSSSSLQVAANPNYWAGEPKIRSLTFRLFSDVAEEALNIRSGEVQGIYDVDPLNFKQVSGVPNTKVITEATYADWWIIQMGEPPFDNPAVRKAIRYCFNMPLINKVAFGGLGTHAWDAFGFYPQSWQISTKYTGGYDPAKAAALLKAAGVKTPFNVGLTGIDTYQDSINEGQVIQQGLKAAGLTATFQAPTIDDWLSLTYGKGNFSGLAFNAGNIPFPFLNLWDYLVDPSALLSAYTKGAPNPSVAALYNKVESAADPQEPALLKQAQEVILNDAVVYFMFGGPVNMILPENVQGVFVNGYGDVRWNKASFS